MLVGGPAELDGELEVELGACEGAVTLPRLLDRESWPEVIAEVRPDSPGLVGQAIVQQASTEGRGERLLVRRAADCVALRDEARRADVKLALPRDLDAVGVCDGRLGEVAVQQIRLQADTVRYRR